FFEMLEAKGGPRPPAWFSSHPNPGRRHELVQAELSALPVATYDYASGKFPSARKRVAQLPPPQRPEQPAVVAAGSRPPGAPTGGFRQLNTQSFSVEYPDGWQVFGDQQSSVVTIAPRQGLVRNASGGVGLGFGTVFSYYRPRRARNLRGATSELVAELRASNPSMQVTSSRTTQVQGGSAMLVYLVAPSPYGGRERDVLLTMARPEGLFYMVFVGPEQGFSQLEPAFERMLASIRFQ
ncbi:MAG: hypothetical protein GY953_40230, partial [bacterium]|nr:hypothetical protein [bacterium]